MAITVEGQAVPQRKQKREVLSGRGVAVWLCAFASGIFVMLCLLQFHSWISLEQGVHHDVKNPFATLFYVVDMGNMSLNNVSVVCVCQTDRGKRIVRFSKLAESLTFKQRQVLSCASSIADDPASRRSSWFTVTVNYRVAWFPLHRSQTFKLKSVVLADGAYLWLNQN